MCHLPVPGEGSSALVLSRRDTVHVYQYLVQRSYDVDIHDDGIMLTDSVPGSMAWANA